LNSLLEKPGCRVNNHNQQQQQSAPRQQAPAGIRETEEARLRVMVLGESLLTRFQEDSLPPAQPIDRDVQLGGHTLNRLSPKDPVDSGVFLGPMEV